jgi:superfamily I DNA/RNA helicase
MASVSQVRAAIKAAQAAELGINFTPQFLVEEWDELVDAWNVTDGDAYVTVPRLGRRTRLGQVQREAAWDVFTFVQRRLAERNVTTWSQLYARLATWLNDGKGKLPYSHVVVDEAQDLSVAQVRFLAAVGKQDIEALFFTGDQGQRMFHLPFSWMSLGIDIRGRSHSLKVNYRTSHQIRAAADRLLPAVLVDVDGVEEGRRGTVSVFDGPEPKVVLAENEGDEAAKVGDFLRGCVRAGMSPADVAILVRSQKQLSRALKAAAHAKLGHDQDDGLTIATMHDAKGLEFRGVAVMACDDDILPDADRIERIGDMAELEAVYQSERHLLYVACTRPRDRLMVSAIAPGSEFLADLGVRG